MKTNILLAAFTLLLIVPNFLDWDINDRETYNHKERYFPALQAVTNMNSLELYIDQEAAKRGIRPADPEYPLLVSYTISCKFFHGFSHWTLAQNWIAAMGQKITGIGLACKVQPEAIMKDNSAGCSQQVLVMMEILKRKQINYRKVGFPHHYTLLAESAGKWYYFDPDMEPAMSLSQRAYSSWEGKAGNLKPFYAKKATLSEIDFHFGSNTQMATLGPINEIPAQNLRFFQNSTALLSKILFLFPLLMLYYRTRFFTAFEKPSLETRNFRLIPA